MQPVNLVRPRTVGAVLVVILAALGLSVSNGPAQSEFPFGRELLLDAPPLRGGKRIPVLEIAADGRGTIDLWCNGIEAQAVIVADTITFLLGPVREQQSCAPERARGDEELIAALSEVTTWRLEGDAVVFTGGKTLRFRPATN